MEQTKKPKIPTYLMFSVIPDKLSFVMISLKATEISSLRIENIIKGEYVEELIKAATTRPDEDFFVYHNVGLNSVMDRVYARELANETKTTADFMTFVRKVFLKMVLLRDQELRKFIPNYENKSFREKCDFINSEVQEVFNKFEKVLKNKGIRNLSFKPLSSLNEDAALDASKEMIVDTAIDFCKHEMILSIYKDSAEQIFIVSDFDRLNDIGTIEQLKKSSLPMPFTVAKRTANWGEDKPDAKDKKETYRLSHSIFLCKGKQAQKIVSCAHYLSLFISNNNQKALKLGPDVNHMLNPIVGLTTSLMSRGHIETACQVIKDESAGLNLDKWSKFCIEQNVKPVEQPTGQSWCNELAVTQQLLRSFDFPQFIDNYIQLTKEARENTEEFAFADYANTHCELEKNFGKTFILEQIKFISRELCKLD